MPELIDCAFPLAEAVTQAFNCHIKANLVSILETVSNSLGRIIHPDDLGYHNADHTFKEIKVIQDE